MTYVNMYEPGGISGGVNANNAPAIAALSAARVAPRIRRDGLQPFLPVIPSPSLTWRKCTLNRPAIPRNKKARLCAKVYYRYNVEVASSSWIILAKRQNITPDVLYIYITEYSERII